MLRFQTFGSTLVKTYPDSNPFDFDPPLWNLSPFPLEAQRYDTQETRDAARTAAESSGYNPFYGAHGTCPIALYDPQLRGADLPAIVYATPPTLQRVVLDEPMEFLEAINPTGNTVVFKVRIRDDFRLLKVVRCMSFMV